jgi:hypothetical protein
MRKAARIVTRLILVIGASLLASILLDLLVLEGPRIIERISSPSLEHRCSALREGMSRSEALETIDGRFPAHFQTLRENSIEIDQGLEGTCKVEIDSVTNKVIKVSRQAAEPGRYDLSGADSYPEE